MLNIFDTISHWEKLKKEAEGTIIHGDVLNTEISTRVFEKPVIGYLRINNKYFLLNPDQVRRLKRLYK